MAKKQLSLVRFMTAGVSESERLSNEDEGQVEDQSIQPGTEQSEIGTSIHDEPQCEAECCSQSREKPNQPTSKDVLAGTKRMQGPQARYVQADWFKQHTWLTLCTSRQKLFCFPCSNAVRRNLMVFSKNADPAFVTTGFCNWRKASDCNSVSSL